MSLSLASWSLLADFNRDGTYEYDLTPYIDRASKVIVKRGVADDGAPRVSTFEVELDNTSGLFRNHWAGSALRGLLEPDVPLQLKCLHLATTYTIWTGYSVSWTTREGTSVLGNRCTLVAQDILGAYLQVSKPLNVTVDTSRDTDGLLAAIAAAAGLGGGDYSFADGVQALPYSFTAQQRAADAMMDAVRAEMGGHFWVRADGTLRFVGRDNWLGVSGATQWGDGASIVPDPGAGAILVDYTDEDRVDAVDVVAQVYNTDYPDVEIWRLAQSMYNRPTANSIAIAAGQTLTFHATFGQPAILLTTPASRTDWLANDAVDGTSTDRTSSVTVTATLGSAGAEVSVANAHSGTIYLTFLRLRGKPVAAIAQTLRTQATKSIPNAKAGRGVTLPVPWVGIDAWQTLRDYAMATLRTYRYAYPRITLAFSWSDDAIVTEMLGLEHGDLKRWTDHGASAITDAFVTHEDEWLRVMNITHELVSPGAGVCRTTVQLAPSYLWANLAAIEYDDFTRADAVGDLGSTTRGTAWANDTGFDINTNTARPNTTAAQAPNVALGSADMVVEVSLSAMDTDTDEEVGVCYRYTDANNYWRAYLDDGSNEVVLEKVIAGVTTEVASPAWTPTATAELRVIVQGNRHRVEVDRIPYIDETDSALNTATRAGLFARSTTSVRFDDWHARGLSIPTYEADAYDTGLYDGT